MFLVNFSIDINFKNNYADKARCVEYILFVNYKNYKKKNNTVNY